MITDSRQEKENLCVGVHTRVFRGEEYRAGWGTVLKMGEAAFSSLFLLKTFGKNKDDLTGERMKNSRNLPPPLGTGHTSTFHFFNYGTLIALPTAPAPTRLHAMDGGPP